MMGRLDDPVDSLFRERYASEVEPWLAAAIVYGRAAVNARKPDLGRDIELALDRLESGFRGGDAPPALIALLDDPVMGALRRFLARFGYRAAAGVARDEHVLVYGSLRRDEPGFRAFRLDCALEPLGGHWIPGELHDLGAYPGLVPGEGRVLAELYRVRDLAVLEALDDYEGYCWWRAQASPYRRTTECLPGGRKTGERVDAWIYRYNGGVEASTRMPGGCWSSRRHCR